MSDEVATFDSTNGLTVLDVLQQRATREPARKFCRFDDGPWHSYGELWERSVGYAKSLVAHGLAKGERVEVWMSSRFEYLIAMFGIQLAGGIYVPLNNEYTPEQIAETIEGCRARLLLSDRDPVEIQAVLALPAAAETEAVSITSDGRLVDTGGTALSSAPDAVLPEVTTENAALIMYTSGTTGSPKGVTFSHGNLTYLAAVKVSGLRYTASDRSLNFFPLHHFNGGFQQIMPVVFCGSSIVFRSAFEPDGFSDHLVSDEITLTAVNSNHVHDLLATAPSPSDAKHGCFRMMLGLALDDVIHARFEGRFATSLLGVYGLTEALGPFIAGTIDYLSPRRSSGRPIPGYEVAIIGANDVPLGPGHAGEVAVRATARYAFFMGYWGDETKTRELYRDGWIHTGDLGYFDADGSFYYLQRLVDQVKRKGRIFAPVLAEDVLRSAPGVDEAVVLGLADDDENETLVGLVVLNPDGATGAPRLEDVQEYSSSRIEAELLPDRWFAVPAIAKDILGKVDRKRLRSDLRRETDVDPRI